MKKINILILIGGVIILTISGWIIFLNKSIEQISPEGTEIFQSEIKLEVNLIIDNGEDLPKTFKTEFQEGLTVFDLLKEKTEESNIILKTKTYDFGVLIEAIGDKENGEAGKYWLYYVNEEMPMVAADKKEIKPGDKIEFKFEKSPF
jgi:hypothetical protein